MINEEKLTRCLENISQGKISVLRALDELSKNHVNHGLSLNYYEEKYKIEKNTVMKSVKPHNVCLITDDKNKESIYDKCSESTLYKYNFKDDLVSKFNELKKENIKIDLIIIDNLSNYDILLYMYDLIKLLADEKFKCKILFLSYVKDNNIMYCYTEALSAFAKSLYAENQDLNLRLINIDESYIELNKKNINEIITYEYNCKENEFQVLYKDDRYIKELIRTDVKEKKIKGLMDNSYYLIAGGLGKLGKICARVILENTNSKVILLGRKEIKNDEFLAKFKERVRYYSVDIGQAEETKNLAANLKSENINIIGIINCAGNFNNSYIINKDKKEVVNVLKAKVDGTNNLEEAFKDEEIELFLSFSSIAAIFGKVGQADYAYANAYLNSYTYYRMKNKINGRSIAVNWPFWLNGGMKIDDYEIEGLYEKLGLVPLPDNTGYEAVKRILSLKSGNYTVLYGNAEKIDESLNNLFVKEDEDIDNMDSFSIGDLKSKTVKWLLDMFADIFEIDKSTIDELTGFDEIGIDSIGFNKLQSRMEKSLGIMKKTLMYELHTINELADYLIDNKYRELCSTLKEKIISESKRSEKSPKKFINKSKILTNISSQDDIAIIGISGRFPGADSCEELWANLKSGKDSVDKIPEDRWDTNFYNTGDYNNLEAGKSYCGYGGFLKDVYNFDPMFFHISPKEANLMDPQERLFLEIAYETFEDAGYNSSRLRYIANENNNYNVGVFAASASTTYNLIGVSQWEKGNYILPNALPWSIANRVSYFMNFDGPSFTVDAACAGGLIAFNEACNSLKNDECKMALVGGVNLYLHPYKYSALSSVKMLSRTGRCYSFSNKADGFVPSESVAAILLKPLSEAVKDGDYIYGSIKAYGINHDGNSNGYMAPNGKAQTSLIKKVINKANISAEDISYVEAHGTGTPVGDPIEINALKDAFLDTTDKKGFCSIGSIKTNIGHSEGAAGIVGIIKVLLQMKNKKLVPSLYADDVSDSIDFENSPFVLQKDLQPWTTEKSRIAGVSSFGAGGANGFVLLEEYKKPNIDKNISQGEVLIPLSAKSEKQLHILVKSMYEFLKKEKEFNLRSVSYTLFCGRNDFDYRVMFTVDSREKLLLRMQDFLNGNLDRAKDSINYIHCHSSKKYADLNYDSNEEIKKAWLEGLRADYSKIFKERYELLHLPHYPFNNRKCFLNIISAENNIKKEEEKIVKDNLSNNDDELSSLEDIIEMDEINIEAVKNMLTKK